MAKKTITYLDIQQKVDCSTCQGTGEVLVREDGESDSTDCEMFAYVCPTCMGKKYAMKKRTVSLESFKGLKNFFKKP